MKVSQAHIRVYVTKPTQIHTFQVLGVLDIIEPGLNRERSLVLKDLAATKKLILQRRLINKEISDDEFSIQIQGKLSFLVVFFVKISDFLRVGGNENIG